MNWFQTHFYVAVWISATAAVTTLTLTIAKLVNLKSPRLKVNWYRLLIYSLFVAQVFFAFSSAIPHWLRIVAGAGAVLGFLLVLLEAAEN
jgi:Mn2+/Fe2+ NRAMP family transporter